MINKLFCAIRDCILFCVLVALVQIALEQNVSFLLEHKESVIHELDRDFIDQLYTAQRQIHAIEEHASYGIDYKNQLHELKEQLTSIEEQYKKNSPGLALLGPIGTTSIVIKEEKLQKKLLAIVNELGTLLHTITAQNTPFEPALNIDNGLNNNKATIKTILT